MLHVEILKLHTHYDITEATGLRKKSITKCYCAIFTTPNLQIPISDTNQYVLGITNDMGISEKVKQCATNILDHGKKRNHLAGKDPMGVVAATTYLASTNNGEKISQRKLADSMPTEVTIRNRCKGLRSIN